MSCLSVPVPPPLSPAPPLSPLESSHLARSRSLDHSHLIHNLSLLEREIHDVGLLYSFTPLLSHLREDRTSLSITGKKETYLGLLRAPAASKNHHAYVGGLVQHLLEMCSYSKLLYHLFTDSNLITPSRVVKGILLHDLHKAYLTFIESGTSPDGIPIVQYGNHESQQLFTNNQKSLFLISEFNIPMDSIDWNIFHSSEGGWAEKAPKAVSTVAKFVYLLDELSGNVRGRIDSGNEKGLSFRSW